MGIIGATVKGVGKGVGKVATSAFRAQKNVSAANAAREMKSDIKSVENAKNGKIRGELSQTIDSIGDAFANVTNHVTFGISGRVANVFSKDKIDYKGMKALRKENEANDKKTTVKDLTLAAAGQTQSDTASKRAQMAQAELGDVSGVGTSADYQAQ